MLILIWISIYLFFQIIYKRQYWSDGSETRVSRRKLLKTANGIGVDYSVYNPLPALGGTHLTALLTDANTVTTINSILVVSYPAAVVLTPVTSRGGGSGGGDIGSNVTYTSTPTYSPLSQAAGPSVSSTTSKNYDNYVFIGASVLGGIMLLGIGGSGLYYWKKKKEFMRRNQKQREDIAIVIKPVAAPIKRKTSVFAVRQNTVIPGNNNDDDAMDQRDREDEAVHPRILEKPSPVDEYNLWGDQDIESNPTSQTNSAFVTPFYTAANSGTATPKDFISNETSPKDLHRALSEVFKNMDIEDDERETTGSPGTTFSPKNPHHIENSPAPGQKKKMMRGASNRSLLGKINQRFKSSKVVPDVEQLETVPEDVAESVANISAKFKTLDIGPRKSKLFLDTAIRPSSARISVKSPRPKSASPKPLESNDSPNASQKLIKQRSSKRLDRATFNGFDKKDSLSLSPSESQRNQEPEEAPPRPSTAVHRIPSAKLQSPTVQVPAHSILSSMFSTLSSQRSDTTSTRTPRQEDAVAPPASVMPRRQSPLPSQQDKGKSAVDERPLSAKPNPTTSQVRPVSTLASLFGTFSPRQDSAPVFEKENPPSETDRPISSVQRVPSAKLRSPAQSRPTSTLASMFGSFSPRQDSAPAAENEDPPSERELALTQHFDTAFSQPQLPPRSLLSTMFGSPSPRQDSAPVSEKENPHSETDRPISAVQRVPSAKLRSPAQSRPTSTLASMFGSFSPRQDSAPASENEDPSLSDAATDQMLTDSQESKLPVEAKTEVANNKFNAPRFLQVEPLVIPATVDGLALGRRPSSLLSNRSSQRDDLTCDTAVSSTAQQPVPFQPSMQLLSKLFNGDNDESDNDDTNDHESGSAPVSHLESAPSISGSSSPAIEDRLAKFRASIAQQEKPVVSNRGNASSLQEIEERLQNYKKTVATLAIPQTTPEMHEDVVIDPDQSVAATPSPFPLPSSPAIEDRLARFRASIAQQEKSVRLSVVQPIKPVEISIASSAHEVSSTRQDSTQKEIEERIQNYQKSIATLAIPQTTMDTTNTPVSKNILSSLFDNTVSERANDDDHEDVNDNNHEQLSGASNATSSSGSKVP